MTTARIETVYTLDGAIKELDSRLTRKIRRIKKRIKRKVKEFLSWCFVGFVVVGFFFGMFYIWLEFGYIL